MRQYSISQCEIKDAENLVEIMKGYRDFYKTPIVEDKKILDFIKNIISNKELGVFFVCKDEEKIIGFATLYSTFSSLRLSKALIMNDLFVLPQYRKQGIGQLIFNQCRKYANENGYAYMEWVTDKENKTAQRFYESNGSEKSDWLTYSIS
ncbi:GNAT family N-acetyltransferase [Niallia taxi]|uniref:GNAT family N-acetyltransferase n=1 Tax=Niallia taxi TaxID=2499688 RepID=UPI00203CB0D9|nr:GNAT family N-acetyltransferase [Niallia taxi]MCM3216674.1 GNAT family N-acetyltransferase [Niallia taxi]